MPYTVSVDHPFAVGRRTDKKIAVEVLRAVPHHKYPTRHEQQYSFKSAHSVKHSRLARSLEFHYNAPFPRNSLHYVMNAVDTSRSDARQGLGYQHGPRPKKLDARHSTFNNVGRDQHSLQNCYNTFVVNNHFCSCVGYQVALDESETGFGQRVVSSDCNATAIVDRTTLVTTNVCVAASCFGVPACNSGDSISLTVTSVRYMFFSDPDPESILCKKSK